MLSYIISFILLLSIIVFIHEYGHYYFAKRYGVKVTRFLIFGLPFAGLDKELIGFTDKSGTRWSIGYFPLGGFVDIFGSRDPFITKKEIQEKYTPEEQSYLLQTKKPYQKILLAFGGPLANFLTAIIIFSMISIFVGKDFTPATISSINEDGPAEKAGLMINDRIIGINGHKIISINDVPKLISISLSKEVEIEIIRNNAKKSYLVKPEYIKDETPINLKRKNSKRRIIGIGISALNNKIEFKKIGPAKAIYYAVSDTLFMCKYILIHIGNLLIGKADISNLSGPIGIAQISGEVVKLGFLPFLMLIAHISISLGLVNLLPIPVLDGGHIMFYTLEKILGRPLKRKTQEFLFRIGFTILMTLMFFTFYVDFLNYS